MSENAEENDTNQSKFYRVLSSEPIHDKMVLFDTISNFLMKDKERQISSEYLDEKDQIASRLTWNNLRNVANSVLSEDAPQRSPIPAWIEQTDPIVIDESEGSVKVGDGMDDGNNSVIQTKEEPVPSPQKAPPNVTANQSSLKNDPETGEKLNDKESRKARKRERAAKREAKKAKKEAKKIKKEAKKRKREINSGE